MFSEEHRRCDVRNASKAKHFLESLHLHQKVSRGQKQFLASFLFGVTSRGTLFGTSQSFTLNVGINDGLNDGLTNAATRVDTQLLKLLRQNPTITIAQAARELGLSTRQAERIVSRLKSEGKLVRVGAKRNGRWEITQ